MTEKEMWDKVEKWEGRVRQAKEEQLWIEKPERAPAAHQSIALSARSAALYCVLLDEFDRACNWFETASDHYLASGVARFEVNVDTLSDLTNAPYQFVSAVYMASLASDEVAFREIADAVLNADREHLYELQDGSTTTYELDADEFYHARCLAALVIDDQDRTTRSLNQLRDAIRANRQSTAHYITRDATFAEGLLEKDPEIVTDAIEEGFLHHRRNLRGEPETDEELICVEATAMLLLAQRAGLDIDIESEFVPTEYVEWLLQESGGQ